VYEPARQRRFEDLGIPLSEVTFCVVDLETTGGSPRDSEITEIGAVKVRGGEVSGTFQTLVNPGMPIPPFITMLTGITHAMVVEAPRIDAVLPAFLEFCGDAVVVGHNVRFDLGFLRAAANRLGYPDLENRSVDTAALARRLVRQDVRNLKLSTLSAHFRSPVTPTHRALDDARATMHVLHGLLERAGSLGVTALEDLIALPTARGGTHYDKIGLARDLPRAPGVYLFRDADDRVIYVGKAKNLRTRVTSYFHGDGRRSVGAMLRELERIEVRVCEGELEAAITEIRLIHAHRPRHNRAQRPTKRDHFVTLTGERFPRLSVTTTVHSDARTTLGPFRNRASAVKVVEAIWDAVPIRRCNGRPGSRDGPCAPAQLGVAFCPCDGSLGDDEYRPATEAIVRAVDGDARLLLEPLERRMTALATAQRFEEAAWVRDRHAGLARALLHGLHWRALVEGGRIEMEDDAGETVLVDRGRYLASWRSGRDRPLVPAPSDGPERPVPPTNAAAAEARLIWSWVDREGVRLVDATGPIALPSAPITPLRPSRRSAAGVSGMLVR
jgi:DNA polymerase-3 subunit epsilon